MATIKIDIEFNAKISGVNPSDIAITPLQRFKVMCKGVALEVKRWITNELSGRQDTIVFHIPNKDSGVITLATEAKE